MLKFNLNSKEFEKLKCGRIGIHISVYNDEIRGLRKNKKIEFYNIGNSHEKVVAVVKDIFCFPSFVDLCSSISLEECGYSSEDIDNETFLLDYKDIIDSDIERTYGVAAILLESIVFECELSKLIAKFLYSYEAAKLMKKNEGRGWICGTGSYSRIESSARKISYKFKYHHRLMIADMLGILDDQKKSVEEISVKYKETTEEIERIFEEMVKCRAMVFFHRHY